MYGASGILVYTPYNLNSNPGVENHQAGVHTAELYLPPLCAISHKKLVLWFFGSHFYSSQDYETTTIFFFALSLLAIGP